MDVSGTAVSGTCASRALCLCQLVYDFCFTKLDGNVQMGRSEDM